MKWMIHELSIGEKIRRIIHIYYKKKVETNKQMMRMGVVRGGCISSSFKYSQWWVKGKPQVMLQTRGNISTWCVFIKWCEVNKGAQHRDLPEELDWLVSRSSTLRVSCDAVKKINFFTKLKSWNQRHSCVWL